MLHQHRLSTHVSLLARLCRRHYVEAELASSVHPQAEALPYPECGAHRSSLISHRSRLSRTQETLAAPPRVSHAIESSNHSLASVRVRIRRLHRHIVVRTGAARGSLLLTLRPRRLRVGPLRRGRDLGELARVVVGRARVVGCHRGRVVVGSGDRGCVTAAKVWGDEGSARVGCDWR